jgi:hypothetical protein
VLRNPCRSNTPTTDKVEMEVIKDVYYVHK